MNDIVAELGIEIDPRATSEPSPGASSTNEPQKEAVGQRRKKKKNVDSNDELTATAVSTLQSIASNTSAACPLWHYGVS